jgi:DNA-binding beta-propeller fold protein YncE
MCSTTRRGRADIPFRSDRDRVRRLVPVGEAPQSLALIDHGETIEDPSGELVADRRIYVLNARSGTVSVVSVVFFDRVFDTFSVGQDLGVVADGHRGKSIYVTTHNAILVIDGGTDRIVGTIQLGHAPWLIAVSPDGSRIYASHPKEDLIGRRRHNPVSFGIYFCGAPRAFFASP